MKYGMPKDRLYVTYFGGADGLESDEDTRQFWLDMGYCMTTLKHIRLCRETIFLSWGMT